MQGTRAFPTSGFGDSGLGVRVESLGFMVWGSVMSVPGLRLGVQNRLVEEDRLGPCLPAWLKGWVFGNQGLELF